MVFDLVGGDTPKRSFLVLKEGGYLVSATQPVSQEEAARPRVSGEMMRLAPGDVLGRIARLLEEGTIRPDVATVYVLHGPGLEGHRREAPRGSWDVAQWAGSGKTHATRQDRASCRLDITNEEWNRDLREEIELVFLSNSRGMAISEGQPRRRSVKFTFSKETNMASKAKTIGSTDPKQPSTAVEEKNGYCIQRVSKK